MSVSVILCVSASCVWRNVSEGRKRLFYSAMISHLKFASEGFLEPDASLADDALVEVPSLVTAAQNYVAEVSAFEETTIDVRRTVS